MFFGLSSIFRSSMEKGRKKLRAAMIQQQLEVPVIIKMTMIIRSSHATLPYSRGVRVEEAKHRRQARAPRATVQAGDAPPHYQEA